MPTVEPPMQLRVICPIAASVTVFTTLLTCLTIVKVKHIWVGGLTWPFFSDMGRDPPAYYVFCVGLSLCATFLFFTWIFNHQYHMLVLRDSSQKCVRVAAHLVALAGIISTPGLPILAIYDTSRHTTVHHNAANWFFYCEIIAVIINTFVTYRIYATSKAAVDQVSNMERGDTGSESLARRKKTLVIQIIFMVLFFIAFLLYIPVGQSLPGGPTPRLTVQQCLDMNLGHTYCTETMRLSATDTTLFDSRQTFSKSQIRAAGQLGCILTLIGYSVSFVTNDYSDPTDESKSALRPVN
ncbi:TPA: hypothetical protein N0F65_005380 [Lagenidium giganteum]|uniref:CWH43-like N-terminal domain-containing protein n=1 Tax=Lagenidium giganteum TaxID=4803 RepID=A0AAV2Z1P4_9STRA|nr:TPA: hypothetical protein N0F65_005380 [Lagenidium giganteum]